MKILRASLLVVFALMALAACLVGGLALDSFYLQHERAAAHWNQRKPRHYQYEVFIQSSFWQNGFLIEIQDSRIIRTINLASGQPAEIWNMAPGSYMHQTGMLWQYIHIDQIFDLVKIARRPPKTFPALLTRINPEMYYALAYKGLLPYERTSCDPSFPRARYNQDYGYPERLALGGHPCTTVMELVSPITIQIDRFQPLP
jgi:hypothetical protein